MRNYNIDDLVDICTNGSSSENRQNKIESFKEAMIDSINALQDN